MSEGSKYSTDEYDAYLPSYRSIKTDFVIGNLLHPVLLGIRAMAEIHLKLRPL
jgi:hypothetical protein